MTPVSILPVVTESCCIWKSVPLTLQAALMENGWLCSQYLSVPCNSFHASWQLCSQSRAVGSQVSRVKSELQFDLVPLARWGEVWREEAAVNERPFLMRELGCCQWQSISFPRLGLPHYPFLSPSSSSSCHRPRVYKLQRAGAATAAAAEVVCMELEEGSSPSGKQLSH